MLSRKQQWKRAASTSSNKAFDWDLVSITRNISTSLSNSLASFYSSSSTGEDTPDIDDSVFITDVFCFTDKHTEKIIVGPINCN
jgi:hypothetical protein